MGTVTSFPLTTVLAGNTREKLTGPRSYYANSSAADDTGSGLTIGTARKTIQSILDDIIDGIDLGGQTVTINATGTFNEDLAVSGAFTGGGLVVLDGGSSSTTTVHGTSIALLTENGGIIKYQKIKFTSDAYGVVHRLGGGGYNGTDVDFGAMGNTQWGAASGGWIVPQADWKISGTVASSNGSHIDISHDAEFRNVGYTATFSANANFGRGFVSSRGSSDLVWESPAPVVGSFTITGPRYYIDSGSTIYGGSAGTLGATFFPGNASGINVGGGHYDNRLPFSSIYIILGSAFAVAGDALAIANNGITYGLMQQATANKLLGNSTGATANIGEISLSSAFTFLGGTMYLANSGVTGASYGSATQSPTFTVDGTGRLTAAANVTITPAVGSITGLGTGVATALAVAVGSAGAPVVFNGAGGTPSSITLTNASGTAANLTAGNVTPRSSFSVHKNNTNQTSVADATDTQVTWSTEIYDVGSKFASDAWTPEAGKVNMTFAFQATGTITAGKTVVARIYKNGSVFKSNVFGALTNFAAANITIDDVATGTDVYTTWAYIDVDSGTATINGGSGVTYFCGKSVSS